MKKIIFLFTLLCVWAICPSFAQTDIHGTWELSLVKQSFSKGEKIQTQTFTHAIYDISCASEIIFESNGNVTFHLDNKETMKGQYKLDAKDSLYVDFPEAGVKYKWEIQNENLKLSTTFIRTDEELDKISYLNEYIYYKSK